MTTVSFNAVDFDDIIDAIVENEYCPEGKLTDGCPLGDDGEPIGCEQCWGEWFSRMGMKESWD